MTTIIPEGEEIRKAVKWISDEKEVSPDKSLTELVDEASLRFDLSPAESESLLRLLKEQ